MHWHDDANTFTYGCNFLKILLHIWLKIEYPPVFFALKLAGG